MIRLWPILVTFVACAQPAPPPAEPAVPLPPVAVSSRVDRAVATTGDILTYTVEVSFDEGVTVKLPEPGAEIAGFRVVDSNTDPPVTDGGRVTQSRWYKLRADLVGSYVLPPVEIAYTTADADGTAATSAIFVEVESVLGAEGEATDIRGLKPLRHIEAGMPWWAVAGIAAVGLLVLALLVWGWRWRRRERLVPAVPAHEIAFAALEHLRQTDFDDPVAVRRYYFQLSEVLRAYVEGRFALNATDLTTEEILARAGNLPDLDRTPLGNAQDSPSGMLKQFLVATDQVKFADHAPSRDEIGAVYEGALSFVEKTRTAPPNGQAQGG